MEKEKHLDGVLTEQDLVRAWVSMLRETKATYAEVDLDELAYQLMYETRIHYSLLKVPHPLRQMLENFSRTKWQWLRLDNKVRTARKAKKTVQN